MNGFLIAQTVGQVALMAVYVALSPIPEPTPGIQWMVGFAGTQGAWVALFAALTILRNSICRQLPGG